MSGARVRWAILLAATAGLLVAALVVVGRPAAQGEVDAETGLSWVALAALPREVTQTVVLIDRGGPFPYPQDGAVFGNREGLLPDRPSGFYREYTVPTPGEDDRGPRRIVTGDNDRQLFYTADHYVSFVRIRR